MRFIYVFSLFVSASLGLVAGTWLERNQAAYMESEEALLAAEQAGMERQARNDLELILMSCGK